MGFKLNGADYLLLLLFLNNKRPIFGAVRLTKMMFLFEKEIAPVLKAKGLNSDNLPGFIAYKMHGSINWFKCLNCGTLNIVENKRCGLFLFDDHEVEHCTKCKCKASNGILLQSEIITPTMIKTINSQLYSNLWSAARRDLMEAKSVTFIGYSLPIADFEFRYLLQRSIPAKSKIEVVLHQSSNPNSTDLVSLRSLLPERRYRDLFAKNHIEFYYDGFADYFSKLLHSNS